MSGTVFNRKIALRLMAAFAIALACAWGFGVQGMGAAQAFAADDAAGLQVAKIAESASSLEPQAVSGSISSSRRSAKLTMAYGDTAELSTNGASGVRVQWKTSNKKVVAVKSTGMYSGKLIAKGAGKATVTAVTGTGNLTCKVTVKGKLSKSSITVTPLTTGKVTLKGSKVKKWKSSNKSIATVTKAGKVTGKTTGKTTLTCTDKKGNKYRCTVLVTCPKITCKMTEISTRAVNGTPIYRTAFRLENRLGKALVLNKDLVRYYPNGSGGSYIDEYGGSVTTGKFFSEEAMTVKAKSAAQFAALSKTNSAITGSGYFYLAFKVGKKQYMGAFYASSGTMAYCTRL